jgi:hypothetical protein
MYKPVVTTTRQEEAQPVRDTRSPYDRAREHYRRFFTGKPVEELRGYRQRLDAAREAIGRRPGQKSWLANQSAVYFLALAQEIELDEAMRRAKGG